ncbi:MAG: adenylyltransferase/cytidyltransferase family protein [Burkholderiaceae bacterium]|nr:adenylyltransferase/cytidyltransferase family protein [Burkholderiaceae bacterium]
MTGRRILAIGAFDLFHVGHLRYLQFARQQGTRLTVAVSSDAICLAVKARVPVVTEAHRLEVVRGLHCVDDAFLQPVSTIYPDEAAAWIAQWGIDHVVGGGGWSGSERWTRLTLALAQRGITVSFAPATEGISTSQLIGFVCRDGNGPASTAALTGPPPLPVVDRPPPSHARPGRKVLALGVFDLFHVGHLRYLQQARALGDCLLVGVAPDAMCQASKGKCPTIPEPHRREVVVGLQCVDEVQWVPAPIIQTQAVAAWVHACGVQVVACGSPWQGSERWSRLEASLALQGIEVVYLPPTEGVSSTCIRTHMAAVAGQ